jgi:hypothetical protein
MFNVCTPQTSGFPFYLPQWCDIIITIRILLQRTFIAFNFSYIIQCSWALLEKRQLCSYSISQHFIYHYRVHKNTPLAPILSQIYSVHTTPSYLSKIHLNIIILPTSSIPSDFLPCGFPAKSYMPSSSPHACYISVPSTPWLHHYNYTWRGLEIIKFLIMQFSPTSYHFISLRFK